MIFTSTSTSVYEITRRDTGRVYVGASWDVPGRWAAHLSTRSCSPTPLSTDLRELGKDAFDFSVIATFAARADAFAFERERIRERRKEAGGVYNRTIDPQEWADHLDPKEFAKLADIAGQILTMQAQLRELKKQASIIRKKGVSRARAQKEQTS